MLYSSHAGPAVNARANARRGTGYFAFSDLAATDDRPDYVGSVDQYCKALSVVELSSCERDMLRAHLRAPDHCITGLDLAFAAGHFGPRIGLKKYGRIGRKIAMAAGLPQCQTDVSAYLAAIFSLADGTQMETEDWNWVLHPTLAEALRKSGIS
ncbi:hypothetical protein [Thalassospira mesophila]|uniref:hypothetical protein n=1 Tax=Thalassospira mesophila TaxID=1293891 RepID=UPI000A1EC196|nr:hypothetical protein [Thalassospira mesophila]